MRSNNRSSSILRRSWQSFALCVTTCEGIRKIHMAESVSKKIHSEIAETQKRRFQLYVLKIGFVTALLGFGGIHIQEVSSFYQALYLVPLVAVFFDLLIMGEHISIRRMGTYLRLHSEEDEKTYEDYVMRHRDKFITVGLVGFTTLSFVAAFFLL